MLTLGIRLPTWAALTLCGAALACNSDAGNLGNLSAGGSEDAGSTAAGPPTTGDLLTSTTSGGSSDDGVLTDGPLLDVGSEVDRCRPPPNDAARRPAVCTDEAPPDSFTPRVEWEWWGDPDTGEISSIMTPLVANLTDDNGDGSIDLCDTPDIVVNAYDPQALAEFFSQPEFEFDLNAPSFAGHIYVLDGETGAVHARFPREVNGLVQPALADIDGDLTPEILVAQANRGPLLAFEHDGTAIEGFDGSYEGGYDNAQFIGSPAIADLDHDGAPEIVVRNLVFSNTGEVLHVLPVVDQAGCAGDGATVVADLDENGEPELIYGREAFTYHGDGTVTIYYQLSASWGPGYVHVADFDADGRPEVVITAGNGVSMLDYRGNLLMDQFQHVEAEQVGLGVVWCRPGAVHDFDPGNAGPEFAFSTGPFYSVVQVEDSGGTFVLDPLGIWDVQDNSGAATGTAFDFLGDGHPEAIYADEVRLWVFDSSDDTLPALVDQPRTSYTWTEYPVVADADNDGSAEIVVVSEATYELSPPVVTQTSPTVQLIGDAEDRWIQSRRIWNQHTYHVSNVREDGTIPAHETPHWKQLNTFRTNVQIEGGAVCKPSR